MSVRNLLVCRFVQAAFILGVRSDEEVFFATILDADRSLLKHLLLTHSIALLSYCLSLAKVDYFQ